MHPRLDCVPRARFGVPPGSYATWTAADQRTERGSCALLNINAGENKCDPLSSSPRSLFIIVFCLASCSRPCQLPALKSVPWLWQQSGRSHRARSRGPPPPTPLLLSSPLLLSESHFLSSLFCQTRSCNRRQQAGMSAKGSESQSSVCA